jgi:hypothetical protein
MPHALRISKQRLGMGQEVVANRDRLRALKVGVTGHHPAGVAVRLPAKGIHNSSDLGRELAGGGSAVETEVQRDLVVARPTRVEGGAGGRDLGEPALDGDVNVLVGVEEVEGACVELFANPAQTPFDRGQLRSGDDPCCG